MLPPFDLLQNCPSQPISQKHFVEFVELSMHRPFSQGGLHVTEKNVKNRITRNE